MWTGWMGDAAAVPAEAERPVRQYRAMSEGIPTGIGSKRRESQGGWYPRVDANEMAERIESNTRHLHYLWGLH